jgi:nucleotide-binding universal stress UspA family protein
MTTRTMRPIRTILAATGLTPESLGGLLMATDLASREPADLHVVHVVEPTSAFEEQAIPGLAERHMKQAKEELKSFCASHGVPDSATLHVLRGDPEDTILKVRAELKADVLVIGRYGKGGLKRGRLGSIANRLVRKCQVCVLVAQPEFRGTARKLGVACDFHEDAQMELCRALELGKALGTEEVVVLAAYEVPSGYHTVMTWEEACQNLDAALREAAKRALGESSRTMPGSPPWRLRLEEGAPASRVPAMVQEEHLDLLVIGTHSRSLAAMALLGRTSEKIIDASGCSVWAERDAAHFQGFLAALKEWAE